VKCAAGRITGDIRVNGHPCNKATYARLSGYVEQSDIHSQKATVHESLMFSAALRMPPHVPRRVRMAFVEEVCAAFHTLSNAVTALHARVHSCALHPGNLHVELTDAPDSS